VTRVARLTGLDRSGVEVAAAVRPGGHVLQVSNGKGASFAEAAAGALHEAAELWGAERPRPAAWGSADEARAAFHGARVEPLGGGDGARRAWALGSDLASATPVLAPAAAIFCPPAGTALLGASPLPWTSNGMGAHGDRAAALLHALLEAVERDALARSLPEGFTPREIRRRLLDPASLARAAPGTAALAARLEARGFRVHLFDATPGRRDLGLPVAGAVLVDLDPGAVPVTAGYACRPARDAALLAALGEAAQSRLTEIHGAREDVLHGDRCASAPLAAACAAARPSRPASALPQLAVPPAAALAALVRRLARLALRPAAFDLPSPPGVHVVKVLVPGFAVSELL